MARLLRRETIEDFARSIGLDRVGITSADPFPGTERAIIERLEAGLLNGLGWFTRERAQLSCRPRDLLPWGRSIVAVAAPYLAADLPDPPPDRLCGRVSRYAWGLDYHKVLRDRLGKLNSFLQKWAQRTPETRIFVDTGKLVERAVAQRAGLGWMGKSTNLIVHPYGTWIFLGVLITDLEPEPDPPAYGDCGRCDLCMRSCPTAALVAPYTLDIRRCISFLTIEHRGAIPQDLRPLLEQWVFGCDICQDVCPHNRKARMASGAVPTWAGKTDPWLELEPLFTLSEDEFLLRFAGTPLKRPRRSGLLRNAAVVLGNLADPAATGVLSAALIDPDPLVRAHAAWALGRLGGRVSRMALEQARSRETDTGVLMEILAALDRL